MKEVVEGFDAIMLAIMAGTPFAINHSAGFETVSSVGAQASGPYARAASPVALGAAMKPMMAMTAMTMMTGEVAPMMAAVVVTAAVAAAGAMKSAKRAAMMAKMVIVVFPSVLAAALLFACAVTKTIVQNLPYTVKPYHEKR